MDRATHAVLAADLGERYHTDLLRRMRVEIEGVRPALLSPETFGLLDELRRFRHLFRHAYGVRLDGARLADLADKAARLRHALDRDRQAFLRALES